jgi:hypothetical protein
MPLVPSFPFPPEASEENTCWCDEKPGEVGEDDVGEDEVVVLLG